MSAAPDAPLPLAAPAALAAFLKGVERRAAVLAELQSGDAGLGDAALARAMGAFRAQAIGTPMARWPQLFWALLLAQPGLDGPRSTRWPDDLPPRGAQRGLRTALLLRVVAGLEEADAAAVLDVRPASLREALARCVPRRADGEPDALAWSRQRAALQARVRDLPTDRALRIGRARETALLADARPAAPVRGRRRWPWALLVVVLTAAALAGTWWWERLRGDGIETVALPGRGQPASRFGAEAALIAHPDFEQLASHRDDALIADAAFLAWSAAQLDASALEADPLAPTLPAPVDTLAPFPETTDAP